MTLGLIVFTVGFMLAQRTISGTVTDESGEPLIGANVVAKGTTVGTVTGLDGGFELNVPEGVNTLVFSYTGYGTQEFELGASNMMDVTLTEGLTLESAVVTALGIKRDEKALGYATQQVDGAEIIETREVNLVNSLQGKIAGVQIQGSPSTLGGSSRITIRGASSFLGNNQPLFVVDGVPIDNSNFATNRQSRGFNEEFGGPGVAYDYGNTAQDIDPESIESMQVLKGAAATALYGQRGANGVILITTKDGSGQKGKGLGIQVNSSISFDEVNNLIPHQQEYGGGATNPNTTHGFYEVIQDGTTYLTPQYSKDGSWGPKYDPNTQVRHWDSWDPDSDNYKETRPWDAPSAGYEEFFEIGQTLQNSISLSGANDLGSFRLGYTNLNQKGTMPNGELNRNAITFNSGYQIHDRIRVGLVGNYIRTDAENRNITGYNNGNPMQAFTQWWQTQLDLDRLKNDVREDGSQQTWNAVGPIVDADGKLIEYDTDPNFFDNPYWVRNNYLQEDTRNRFFGNANVTIDLLEGLSLTGRAGTDFYQFDLREGIPIASVETSYYGETDRRFQETNLEARLNYNKDFNNISFQGALGVNRMRQYQHENRSRTSGGIALEGFYNVSNSVGSQLVSTTEEEWGINSVFGIASFGFNNWFYVDLAARNDWSSTLPADNNSYFYPSASLSAVLTELPFLSGNNILSFAKIRASYAQVGNDANPYSLTNTFAPLTPNYNGSPRYEVPGTLNNSELKPELTSEYEFGVDLRFLNGRLGIDAAYFDRTTENQIFSVPSSAATGYNSRFLNAGEMRNSGVELQITGTPIQTNDFRLDLYVNAAQINNEVVELIDGVDNIGRGGTWAAELRIAEGESYMGVYGQDYIRENYEEDADGNIIRNDGRRVVDENGYYKTTSQRVFLGSAIADWTGGFGMNISYKGLFAGAALDFQKGGIIHSTSLQWAAYSGMLPITVSRNGEDDIRANGLVLDGVKEDGSENDIVIDDVQTYYQSTFGFAAPNVYDASFVKLRDVRIGYRVPDKVFGSTPFNGMTITLYGRNLAILSSDLPHLDPQLVTSSGNDQGLENAQVPSTRSYGVNLTFNF